MADWLDTQEPEKLERSLELYRTEPALVHIRDYAGDDERFGLWLALANQSAARRLGISIFDLADYSWRDDFDAGTSPRSALMGALEADDTYGPFIGALIRGGE